MTSRTLRIVVTDIEAEWLVPVTASISWDRLPISS